MSWRNGKEAWFTSVKHPVVEAYRSLCCFVDEKKLSAKKSSRIVNIYIIGKACVVSDMFVFSAFVFRRSMISCRKTALVVTK